MVHLDTSIAVAHLRGDRHVTARFSESLPSVEVSTVVVAELTYGVYASVDPSRARARLEELLSSLAVVAFDSAAAEAFGHIRFMLRRKGRPIGDLDMLIAATAMSRGATLVTHNRRHFAEVDGLEIADWIDGVT